MTYERQILDRELPGEPAGFVKLLADTQYGELLGGHLIGPDPTLSEALQKCFHGLTGHMINL